MLNSTRIQIYVHGLKYKTADGKYRLTSKQRRRVHHKHNSRMWHLRHNVYFKVKDWYE